MSGLSNEPRTSGRFVNFKEGMLINNGKEFTSITGDIIDMDIMDAEFNKQPYRKVVLYIQDDEGTIYMLGFPLTSGYGNSFFRIAPNIDYSKSVTISGGTEKLESGNSWGKMFVQQDGKYVKHYFKKGEKANDSVPQVNQVKVGTGKNAKTVADYSDRDAFIEKVLTDLWKNRIQKVWPNGADKKAKGAAAQVTEDLPWEKV